ncbi:hypothetical protein [Aeoliella sp.]|uniref:hypothetical protein n=1 Tax=Aeoliella sp. TaxID=2795800 RepID=UPI003CCBB77B
MTFLFHPRTLLALVVVNVLASILHYVDNICYFSEYPEPTWLNPCIIDLFWFVMTPFAVFGYWYYKQNWFTLSRVTLAAYSVMSLLVLGHYLIAPPWQVSFRINLFILIEAVAALVLLGYVCLSGRLRLAT